ncbi:MAG TPA: flagellar biosynthesis protein FlhF, partial [Gammaproteobacteria bacterium]|nr:flagellar biosynthesis protein FlhF [Gammaproteobacteria bacterium]
MNIRRFVAPDMREALAAIRSNLGSDAVMLSSKKLPNGVEVIAAIDYDDSLLAAAGDPEPSLSESALAIDDSSDDVDAEAEISEYERVAAERLTAGRRTSEPSPLPAAQTVPDTTASMAEEIKDLRRLLETQLGSLAWNDLNRRSPVRARLLREMHKLGVDAGLAAQLADAIPPTHDSREALRALVRMLGERLPLVQWDMAERGGIFAVVGPTGVGKTTSIAKIA